MKTARLLTATCAAAVASLGAATLHASAAAPKPAPLAVSSVKIGMSAPAGEWSSRLAETGPVQARRLFGQLSNMDSTVNLAKSEVAAGRYPITSFKVPNNDWAGVGTGKYDTQLRALTSKLAALPGKVFVTLHHEPTGDGTAANFAAMQRRALPILAVPANVEAGVIVNGYWWSAKGQGYTDAEIAQWLPADVLSKSEIVASDTYHGGTLANPGENAGVKIRRMSEWATRVGVARLGIGEYNGLDAAAITAAGDAVLADPRFAFAAVFNSNENNREGVNWQLTGARLTAFKETLRKAAGTTSTPTPTPTTPRPTATPTTPRPTTTPTPTATTPRPTTTPTATPTSNPAGVLIGMSAPNTEWSARLAETGPVQARRLFGQLDSMDSTVNLAKSEIAAGRYPILSFKISGNDWAGVAAGKYDAQLRSLTTKLDALPGQLFVTLHHEPDGDGTPAAFAAMQRRALPILGAPSNVEAGVVVNGFWWSPKAQGLTDAEIAQWLPTDVLRSTEIVAADTYHAGTAANPGDDTAGPKIRNMSAWATRVGVSRLGLGEYNGITAASINDAGKAIFADRRFVFAAIFNSNRNNGPGDSWQLTGDRLKAFQQTLAQARADG